MVTKQNSAAQRPLPAEQTGPGALAVQIARLMADRHCREVLVLDLRGHSPVTDFYVIATGTSDRQMRAIADEIAHEGAKVGSRVWHVAGLDSATWILLDFVDVVAHLFAEGVRHHYDLEMLWGDVPRVEWSRPAGEH
ncbi:MAG: ribosome silencing factor [Planctomycetes bacterium]|nr:ribosome silencing factor [Planctomycetota bacterium]